MANSLETLFGNIANAIRSKTGEIETMKPSEFAENIKSITVGGSGKAVISKAINFYDVEGNLVYSYTRAEAALLTELPEVPALGNLEGEWTHTLARVKSEQAFLNVGAVYTKNGNPTVIAVIEANSVPTTLTFNFDATGSGNNKTINLYTSVNSTTPTTSKTMTGTGTMKLSFTPPSYVNRKYPYYCIFEIVEGVSYLKVGANATNAFFFGASSSKTIYEQTALQALTIYHSSMEMTQFALYQDYSLKYVCSNARVFATYNMYNCYSLKTIVCHNNSSDSPANYSLNNAYSIDRLVIGMAANSSSSLTNAYSLRDAIVVSLTPNLYFNGSSPRNLIILYTGTPGTVKLGTAIQRIYVLDDMVETYKTTWSSYASKILPLSNYPDY